MATRKKTVSPAPAPAVDVDDPELDAIESEIPPPPKRRPNEKRVRRTTEEVFNVPVGAEDQDDDDEDDTLDAEIVDTDLLPEKPKSALDNLLEQLTGDTAGLRVYVTRKEDSASTGLRFRNPCLVQRPIGSMDFREAFGVKMEVELAIQRRWGGGEYEIEIRRNGAYKTRWQTVIEDPPIDAVAGADTGNGKTPASYVPPSAAPSKSLYAELKELRETSEILGWGPQRAAATPDAASMLDSTFGLVTKVMEITKPFMPEPAAVAPVKGMSALDAAVSLGTAFLGSQQGQNLLGALTTRIMAPQARPNPGFVVPPSGGIPPGQVASQIPPQGGTANGTHGMAELPPEMQREAAKQTAVNEFLGNVVVGLKHGEDQGFAIVMLTRACRVWPELIPELYPTLRQPPEVTIGQLSMLVGEDLSAYPGAVEWIEVLQADLLEHEIFQGVEVREPGAGQDSDALASDDGSGGGNPAETGVSQEATAAPVFELQLPEAASDPGPVPAEVPEVEYYGGTDDE